MHELEDIWLNAITKLPDAKPLADLFRSATPMPPGARDMMAELLSPGHPDICGGRLAYEQTTGLATATDKWLPIIAKYHEQVGKGESSQDAAAKVGEKHKKADRTVYRYINHWKQLVARLSGKEP